MAKHIEKIVLWLSVGSLACLFAYSGIVKCFDANAFYKAITGYRVFPANIVLVATYVVPAFEVVCAVGLLLRSLRKGASLMIIFLLVAFIILLASAWWRGIDVDCGCFGSSDSAKTSIQTALFRDVLLLMMAVFAFVKLDNKVSVRPGTD